MASVCQATIVEGGFSAEGLRFAIIVSRFNSLITERLLEGALGAIRQCGGDASAVVVCRTPGAFEIPGVALKLGESARYDAIICLGAVIRGATPHFEYISSAVTSGITQAQIRTGLPIAYGVLTPNTVEEAIERAGTKSGNKGFEAALCAIESANLYRELAAVHAAE